MATLLYHNVIDDIRAVTNDPTYHLHTTMQGLLVLRQQRSDTWKDISPPLSHASIATWLHAFLTGIEVGYMTAKRGH